MAFKEIESLKADRGVTFDLMDHLRRAFEDFCNTYHKPIPFRDAFMAVHNFHKLIIADIAARCEMTDDDRATFLQMSVDTYQKAVDDMIAKRKSK